MTWALEAADPPTGHQRFHIIPDLGQLPALVENLQPYRKL